MSLAHLLLVAGLASAAPAAPAPAPAGWLTRLADPVAWLDGEAEAEVMLFHWDKKRPLDPGDGVRLGVAGMAELFLPDDGAGVRLFGEAHVFLERDDDGTRVLRFLTLDRAVFELRSTATRILLPGGIELAAQDTWFRVTRDPFGRHFLVRNAGSGAVAVSGPVVPAGVAAVAAGHEMEIPVVMEPTAPAMPDDVWNGYRVVLPLGVHAERSGDELRLEGEGVARVGGARIRVHDGSAARIWRPLP